MTSARRACRRRPRAGSHRRPVRATSAVAAGASARCRRCSACAATSAARWTAVAARPTCSSRRSAPAAVEIARTRAAAEGAVAGLAGAPVVWLRHHDVRWVRPAADALARQRAYLLALAAAAPGPDLPEPASPDDDVVDGDPAGPTAGNHLCALCEGRCCWAGGRNDAFLRAEHLRRWLARHVGASWADAVDRYMGLVPERHVENSCLHHGARGCTLPREMRSCICNEYSCASLEQVDGLARKNAGVTVIAGIVRAHAVHAVAAVSASGIRTLPGAAPDVAAPNPA